MGLSLGIPVISEYTSSKENVEAIIAKYDDNFFDQVVCCIFHDPEKRQSYYWNVIHGGKALIYLPTWRPFLNTKKQHVKHYYGPLVGNGCGKQKEKKMQLYQFQANDEGFYVTGVDGQYNLIQKDNKIYVAEGRPYFECNDKNKMYGGGFQIVMQLITSKLLYPNSTTYHLWTNILYKHKENKTIPKEYIIGIHENTKICFQKIIETYEKNKKKNYKNKIKQNGVTHVKNSELQIKNGTFEGESSENAPISNFNDYSMENVNTSTGPHMVTFLKNFGFSGTDLKTETNVVPNEVNSVCSTRSTVEDVDDSQGNCDIETQWFVTKIKLNETLNENIILQQELKKQKQLVVEQAQLLHKATENKRKLEKNNEKLKKVNDDIIKEIEDMTKENNENEEKIESLYKQKQSLEDKEVKDLRKRLKIVTKNKCKQERNSVKSLVKHKDATTQLNEKQHDVNATVMEEKQEEHKCLLKDTQTQQLIQRSLKAEIKKLNMEVKKLPDNQKQYQMVKEKLKLDEQNLEVVEKKVADATGRLVRYHQLSEKYASIIGKKRNKINDLYNEILNMTDLTSKMKVNYSDHSQISSVQLINEYNRGRRKEENKALKDEIKQLKSENKQLYKALWHSTLSNCTA